MESLLYLLCISVSWSKMAKKSGLQEYVRIFSLPWISEMYDPILSIFPKLIYFVFHLLLLMMDICNDHSLLFPVCELFSFCGGLYLHVLIL